MQDSTANQNKIKQEKKEAEEMDIKIKDLEKKNKILAQNLDMLKHIQNNLKEYETFLIKVKDKHSETFSDLNNVIETYKTLEDNYKNISRQTQEAKEETKEFNQDMKKQAMEAWFRKQAEEIQEAQERKRMEEMKQLKEEKIIKKKKQERKS